MENFTAYNPTQLFFGKNVHQNISNAVIPLGNKVLLLTGKGSVKKYGYYDLIVDELQKANKQIVHFEGIKPNPVVEDAEKAINIAKENQIDFILALGGGSVIDTAKIVGLAYANNLAVWDIMKHKVKPKKNIPLVAVLTLAATGTEMNGAAVLQNHKTNEKIGYYSPLMFPKYSFLDPSFTISVPKEQTINGIIDLMAHSLEAFFAYGDAPLSDRFVAGNLLETMAYAPLLLDNLNNYDLRARMMWSATVAENGTTTSGRAGSGDWGPHALAHHISLLWDTAHGKSLSVIFPAWMKAMEYKINERLLILGKLLTGKSISPTETIDFIESFFKQIEAPVIATQIGLDKTNKQQLLNLWRRNKPEGSNVKLNDNDYQNIIELI